MRKTITLASFRRQDRAEEAVIRAMMPTVSTADPEPMTVHAAPTAVEVIAVRNRVRLVRPLTATIAERASA